MANIWQSDRLVYRKVTQEDDEFLTILQSNSLDFIQSAPVAPAPTSKKDNEFIQKKFADALLGVVICLQPDSSNSESDSKTSEGENSKDSKDSKGSKDSKPTPIGILMLVAESGDLAHHRHGHMGLWISSAYQGKGFGSEAIRWALNWAFRMVNLHRVDLSAFEWNTGAVRLYEKLGFKIEGRKREHMWYDGRYWDEIEMGILQREWKEKYGDATKESSLVASQ